MSAAKPSEGHPAAGGIDARALTKFLDALNAAELDGREAANREPSRDLSLALTHLEDAQMRAARALREQYRGD